MSRFNRPNPDVWQTADIAWEQSFAGGDLRIELWEHDGSQVWCLVVDDDRHTAHSALSDEMAAMLLRVMRDE